MGRAITATALAIALVAGIGSAAADTGRHLDPRDSSGPLDIRVLRHGHGGDRLRHTIEMQGDWGPRDLHCGNKPCRGLINVYFNTDADDDFERIVQIFHHDGELRAAIVKFWYEDDCRFEPVSALCKQGSRYIGDARRWRPDGSAIGFSMPVTKLRRKGTLRRYNWRAEVYFRYERECRSHSGYDMYRDEYSCIDHAPDYEWITHRL